LSFPNFPLEILQHNSLLIEVYFAQEEYPQMTLKESLKPLEAKFKQLSLDLSLKFLESVESLKRSRLVMKGITCSLIALEQNQ